MDRNKPNGPYHRPGCHSIERRDFLKLVAGSAVAVGVSPTLISCGKAKTGRKAIVLGLDGLDPVLVKFLIDAGRAPNFKKLAEMGSFMRLGTTMPALSPVAWSTFITGTNPGEHGIPDFIARDPATYEPVFSIWESRAPDIVLDFGDVHLPIKGGQPVNLRQGKPFWAYLTEQGIPAVISKLPTNFPVEETATFAISGMGTPDVADSYGVFSYYTSDYFEHYPEVEGGNIFYVDVEDNKVQAILLGPVDTLHTARDTRQDRLANHARLPFTIHLDPEHEVVRIDIQGRSLILQKGEYSDWVPVEFTLLPVIGKVAGIARFLLKAVRPHFQLYVTPVNLDPERQSKGVEVTYPASYGADIARAIGSFWTKGLPADTKAFDYGILDDEEYVKQAELILRERMDLFDYQWSRFNEGLFFFYVSSTDQDAHMLWRNMDKTHPMHAASDLRFSGYLLDLYEEMDRLVGKVLPAVDDDTLLLICSDHGFAQFGRRFHLNSWLRKRGYLTLKPGAERKDETSYLDVDWAKTVAYGIGFNGLYLNLVGREGQGIVEPGKVREWSDRIRGELESITDPDTGRRPVARVYKKEELYTGQATPLMPELLVGYTPGFRCASRSVIGATGTEILDVNPWAWSGDHSMARDLVPGSLFSSRPVKKQDPNIIDLPVTLLEFFGIERPSPMTGMSIFKT